MTAATRRTALVAEDDETYRIGLASVLARRCGFDRVIEAASLDEAMDELGVNDDISFATFDISMPGMHGVSSLHGVRQVFPALVAVVVTASQRRDDMLAALAAGVAGYVPKTLPGAEFSRALDDVLAGRVYVPWSVTVLPRMLATSAIPQSGGKLRLTRRQEEILRLLRARRSNKEIARELGLAENTVKVHAAALYRALGINSRTDVLSLDLN